MTVQQVAGRPPPPAAEPAVGGRRAPRVAGLQAAGGFLLAEALLLVLLRAWQPRFFYIDDKQAQYLPMWRWLGQHLSWTGVPTVNPDMGSAGALVADLQYGTLDPFHWALAWGLSRLDGLNAAGWGLHVLAVVVLGLGIVALGRLYGVRPGWCVAAAVGAANSGFLFWFAASWWPAAWGTALLPWLWWAMASRARRALPVAVLVAYLTGASGYPYALPFAGVVVVGVLVERWLREGRAGLVDRRSVGSLLAAAGGLAMAAPGLLATIGTAAYTQRASLDNGPLENTGDFVPNLLDVVLGGTTTSPQVQGWWGTVIPSAAMATAVFALPVLALLDVRAAGGVGRLLRTPGVITAGALVLAAVVATQTPTVVASLRFPFRYAVVYQVVLPLLVVILVTRLGLRVTTRRVTLACSVLTAQAALAVARTPAVAGWHVAVAVGLVAATAGLVWVTVRAGRFGPRIAVAGLVAVTVLAPLGSVATAVAVNDRFAAAAGTAPSGLPADALYNGLWWPADVGSFREAAVRPGLRATVVQWTDSGPDRGFSSGVPVGNAALFSDMQVSFGYTSVGQRGWAERWCQNYLGETGNCGDAVALLTEDVPGTGLSWLEASSQNTLLLDVDAPAELSASLGDRWRYAGVRGSFDVFTRTDPRPGRVTWTGDGVTSVDAVSTGYTSESYDVVWTAVGDRQVLTRIPWWPGYEATLDGRPLEVAAVDDTLLTVQLPPGGGEGELVISFRPPGLELGLVAVGVGALMALVGVGLGFSGARRRADRSAPA